MSYGGENGFNQAIELSADALANVKFIHEKRLLSNYMGEIARDTGRSMSSTLVRRFVVSGVGSRVERPLITGLHGNVFRHAGFLLLRELSGS